MNVISTEDLKECRICGKSEFEVILDYGLMPMAGGFVYEDDPLADSFARLRLVQCLNCGLLQTYDCVPPDSIFRKYSYQSSVSGDLREHFVGLSKLVSYLVSSGRFERPKSLGLKPLVVEIGCNDGVFLKPLREEMPDAVLVGVDPSDVARGAWAGSEGRWDLLNEYATTQTSLRLVRQYGKADVVVACNVFAHTDSPREMMAAAAEMLVDGGKLVVEVQYKADLIDKCQFDTVYHEHCCYYSLADLIRLGLEHGLIHAQFYKVSTHNGSIRLVLYKPGQSTFVGPLSHLQLGREAKEADKGQVSIREFAKRASKARERIMKVFDVLARGRTPCMAYGAAGRATILLNWCGLGDNYVFAVADDSPLRQGRVVPGVKIPIIAPDLQSYRTRQPLVVMISAWNYANAIMAKCPEFEGTWMVPLPDVRLI